MVNTCVANLFTYARQSVKDAKPTKMLKFFDISAENHQRTPAQTYIKLMTKTGTSASNDLRGLVPKKFVLL